MAPDLLGYGENIKADDYSFNNQVQNIIKQIRTLEQTIEFTLSEIILIPHPMAGIHAMLLC